MIHLPPPPGERRRNARYRGLLSNILVAFSTRQPPSPQRIGGNRRIDALLEKLLALLSNGPPAPSSIVCDVKLGRAVDIQGPDATSRAIIDLAADPRELGECGHRARAAVGNTFNWEAEFGPLISRLEQVVGDRRHSDRAPHSAG